jgi:hypothetical protein
LIDYIEYVLNKREIMYEPVVVVVVVVVVV